MFFHIEGVFLTSRLRAVPTVDASTSRFLCAPASFWAIAGFHLHFSVMLQRWCPIGWRGWWTPLHRWLRRSSSWSPWIRMVTAQTRSNRGSPPHRCPGTTWTHMVSFHWLNPAVKQHRHTHACPLINLAAPQCGTCVQAATPPVLI